MRDKEEENLEQEAEVMKDDQLDDDEVEPAIITLEKIPVLEEQNSPSDDEEDEPEPKQIQARPSQHTRLRSELKNLSTSYNQEVTKELEGLRDRANLIMELSKIADAYTIAKSNKANEEEPQSFEEAYKKTQTKLKEKNGEMQSRKSSMI